MNVPFVDLDRQYQNIKPKIDAARREVVEEAAFIAGSFAQRFEEAFSEFVGTEHAVGCGSGTDALELSLEAMGIGKGDEVIVPALTWISTAEAVSAAGASPVFAKIDPDTYTLDPSDTARKITDATAALLPVHLYGHLADMPGLRELANVHDLNVLEDCAQAHGASLDGCTAGTWGDAAAFSFYPSKNLGAWGDAGAVLTNDQEIAHVVRLLGNHGQEQKHRHQIEGRNSRLDGLQAAILSTKLPHLSDWNRQRRELASHYDSMLSSIDALETPHVSEVATHVYHLYVVEIDRRDALKRYLDDQGVSTSIHYPTALPFQPCYEDRGHSPSDFPTAHCATDRVLSLPMFPEMKKKEVEYVADCIRTFYNDV